VALGLTVAGPVAQEIPLLVVPGTVAAPAEEPARVRPAPPPPRAGASPIPAESIRSRIHELWFARKEALEASDTVQASARVEELRAYLAHEGITADRDIARGFAYEGYENLREGNYERAREAFLLAGTFDPWLPQAQMGYAWSLLRSGRGVVTFVNEYSKGVRLAWTQLLASELELANLVVVAAAALLFSSIMFCLVVVARCQGRIRHDLFEVLRRVVPEPMARWGAWAIFLLPLLVWAGGFWLLLFWLMLAFRYMRPAERLVGAVVFLMLGLSPLGVGALTSQFEASTDPEVRVAVRALQSGYSPETLRAMGALVRAHPDSPELHLVLGSLYARGERLGEAFDTYQRVLQLAPSNIPALLNTGNIYFRLGEYAQAVSHYKQAAQVRPDLAAAYWNMHLAQSELLHFDEADASLARARELDGPTVGRLLATKKGGGQEILLEQPADLTRVKRELRERPAPGGDPIAALQSPLSLASAGSLFLALLLSMWGRRAEACERCGRPSCSRCALDNRSPELCARCAALLLRKDGIPSDVRMEQMRRLGRKDRLASLVRRGLSILLPGSGHILAGRLAIGLPVLMLWTGSLMFLLARDRLLQSPRVPVSDLPPTSVGVTVALMALLWIAGNVSSSQRIGWMEKNHGA
jgi:tetratricopeptide (TPR) repeat protein